MRGSVALSDWEYFYLPLAMDEMIAHHPRPFYPQHNSKFLGHYVFRICTFVLPLFETD